jgi:glutathione S-transferase
LKVFGLPLSPFVRKVHIAAAEKGIAIETVPVDPRNPSPEFLAASPFRKMPALQDGDFFLADSTAIMTYFEALHPAPVLIPAEAKARAKAIFFEEAADTVLQPPAAKLVFNRFVAPKLMGRPGDEEAATQGERDLAPLLDWLEEQAPGSGYLVGDYSVGDIAMASLLRTLAFVGCGPDAARRPSTAAWFDRVVERPAWRQVIAVEEELAKAFA